MVGVLPSGPPVPGATLALPPVPVLPGAGVVPDGPAGSKGLGPTPSSLGSPLHPASTPAAVRTPKNGMTEARITAVYARRVENNHGRNNFLSSHSRTRDA